MGRDVVAAVQEVARAHGGLDEAKAATFVQEMESGGRLVKELWS